MQKGWDAKGLLTPLYARHGGREGLAEKTGVSIAHLSGVNNGKRELGIDAARKIAEATGISVLELGAPVEEADEKGRSWLDLLEELRVEMAAENLKLREDLAKAIRRIRALEKRAQPESQTATADGP